MIERKTERKLRPGDNEKKSVVLKKSKMKKKDEEREDVGVVEEKK